VRGFKQESLAQFEHLVHPNLIGDVSQLIWGQFLSESAERFA
jgi:hypothetical protein